MIESRLVNEVNGQAGLWLEGPDFATNGLSSERQIQSLKQFQIWPMKCLLSLRGSASDLFAHTKIQRRDDADVVTGAGEAFCQSADHVGETSGLGDRKSV